ncbi:LOW QUALITY PROTEIN: uncharacterized protein [Delphinus delphis]|uniref:LOW QUALITY PROTEIN: uncharacterized protein n=1 Tax=Delphinus delphis TaxID=9728 RepID=UPI0028C38C2E|nr:LOW QUALITY PROTEIN: uncharacterized protein LOC132437423 [Delphinus delphis]
MPRRAHSHRLLSASRLLPVYYRRPLPPRDTHLRSNTQTHSGDSWGPEKPARSAGRVLEWRGLCCCPGVGWGCPATGWGGAARGGPDSGMGLRAGVSVPGQLPGFPRGGGDSEAPWVPPGGPSPVAARLCPVGRQSEDGAGTIGFPRPNFLSRPIGTCSSSSRRPAPRGNATRRPKNYKSLHPPRRGRERRGAERSGAVWLEMETNKGKGWGSAALFGAGRFTRYARSLSNLHDNPARHYCIQPTTCQRSQTARVVEMGLNPEP